MRDVAVSCINSTYYEFKHDRHVTWNDDRICNPCRRTLDLFAQRRAQAEAEADEGSHPST